MKILEWLLNEKIVLCLMAFTFALLAIVLIKWGSDKDYIMQLFGIASMLIGALLRGITHQDKETKS